MKNWLKILFAKRQTEKEKLEARLSFIERKLQNLENLESERLIAEYRRRNKFPKLSTRTSLSVLDCKPGVFRGAK